MKCSLSKAIPKFLLFLSVISFYSISGFAQSIILRPGMGERYILEKPNYSLKNNFDPSFDGNYKLHRPTANIALELMYPRHSYELVFTSQLSAVKFYSYYRINDTESLGQVHLEDGGISQFQLFYNRFFNLNNNNNKYSLKPFVGAGIGLGINRPKSFYDSAYFKSRFYGSLHPDDYIDFLLTYKSLNKISYSLAIKMGFSLKVKNVERARIHAVYNLGLNKIIRNDILYYHTNTKYWGSSTSKGSQFSFLVSMPIYLKRKK